jgi:hypothetical protein
VSARIWPGRVWRAVLPVAAGGLLAGMSACSTFARQAEAANTGAAAHGASSGENKGGRFHAPQLKIAPAKAPPIVHGGSNGVDRNAIGMPIARPDGGQKPTGPNLGRAATLTPPVLPLPPLPPAPLGAAAGLGRSVLPAPHMPAPAARPLVLSRGSINGGAAFARPGTVLAPLGGPAEHAAAGINGTTIERKH